MLGASPTALWPRCIWATSSNASRQLQRLQRLQRDKVFPSFGMRFSYLDNVLWIKIVALTQNDSFRGLCMYLSNAMLSLIHKTLLNARILTVQVTLPNIKSLQTKCLHTFLDGWVAFSLVPGLYAIHSDFGFQEHGIVLWAGFQWSCFGRVGMWVEI